MKFEAGREVTVGGLALLLFAASLVLFWPGVAMYDSVQQFAQARAGEYEDWHPPAMAQLWSALHAALGGAGEPMLVVQMGLYWAGFGLIAAALAQSDRTRGAAAVLAIGMLPLFVGWQAVILKDTQMLGAMLAACGLVAWSRLRGARMPVWALVGVAVLIAYATAVRANAVFATVPLLVMLFGPARWWQRIVLGVAGVLVMLALAPAINHGPLGARASGVERTEAFYDLAAIAAQDPASATGLTPAEAHAVAAKHCIKPFFWDPLGDATRCGADLERLHGFTAGPLYRMLAEAVLRHPLAYATHRLGHLNSTERWLVAAKWPSAAPPATSEPNDEGLANPGAGARDWQMAARFVAETPLGWPVAWVVVAACGLAVAARRAPSAFRDLARALFVSALTLEASFAVVSISSDLRYHLWPMVVTALASVLLIAEKRWPRRETIVGGVMLLAVVASGTAARLVLPAPPTSYKALLE